MKCDMILRRVREMFAMARKDEKYAKLTSEYEILEMEFARIARKLSDEEQDILWGFICTSDAMNWRILELVAEREVEVLTLIAKGYGNKEIAEKLFLSVKTVESYKARIKTKLNLYTQPELVEYAIKKKLLQF
jgi:DNA-binding NarL/FixJ family response regulator